MRSDPDWADGIDDHCHGFAPELVGMGLDCRGTVWTSRAVKSFPPYGRPLQRSTKPMNASSSIMCPMGLLTSIDWARRLRPIPPIRRASSESSHVLPRTPTYRLAGRIRRGWTIRRTTKRSTIGASLAPVDDGEVRFINGSKPLQAWAQSPPRRRTSAPESRWEPTRIHWSLRGAISDSSMSSKHFIGG
jgi:hypothetical protein